MIETDTDPENKTETGTEIETENGLEEATEEEGFLQIKTYIPTF